MNQTTLHLVFKAMMYTARKEGFEVDEKYTRLETMILDDYDYDVTDMIDNLENVYQLIDQKDSVKDEVIRQHQLYEDYLLERLRIAEESRKESENNER